MDCVSFITGYFFSSLQSAADAGFSFIWNLAAEGVGNLYNLGRNGEALGREMRDLVDIRDDLLAQVEMEERQPQMKRTQQVMRWFGDVATLQTDVAAFLVTFAERTTCLQGCSFQSLHTNYGLGSMAAELRKRTEELKNQRGNLGAHLVAEAPPEVVEEVPAPSSTLLIGGEKTLSEIQGFLRDDAIGIIGIYGMGGIGKTTLLTKINNSFLTARAQGFDVVIWITVTKDLNILKIQKEIGERVGLSLEGNTTGSSSQVEDQAKKLFKILSKKKFLLLLDDMWEKLDLKKIGVPYPSRQNKSKIALTTRSKDVCTGMDAQKQVKVNFLDKMESWQLFSEKVGTEVDLYNPTIQPLAQIVARKCGGLPLALITVGRAMSDAKTIMAWEEAIAMLRESPNELLGMEEDVFSLLKFSFDRLKDETTKQCLLYCSLFPEDYEIDSVKLVECWVGEGFLDTKHSDCIDRARSRGRSIITRLKAACLLESSVASQWEVQCIKMHDVVREMALWLTGGYFDSTNIFLAYAGQGVTQFPNARRWGDAKRVSLMYSNVAALPQLTYICSHLLTLLFTSCNSLAYIPHSFFMFTPALHVLDLSLTQIKELPDELGSLVELKYLNLSSTHIKSLPKDLGKLVKLRQLDLSWTYSLSRIPREAIVTLERLQSLDMCGSGYSFGLHQESDDSDNEDEEDKEGTPDQVTYANLECSLPELQEFGLRVKCLSSLESLVSSDKLSRCTRSLLLYTMHGLTAAHLSSAFERLEKLRELFVMSQSNVEELRFNGGSQVQHLEVLYLDSLSQARIVWPTSQRRSSRGIGLNSPHFPRLRILSIEICHGFKELTWLAKLTCLESISLRYCNSIEELLMVDGSEGTEHLETTEGNGHICDCFSFPMLRRMSLISLPSLRSISSHLLLLPSLERLVISNCPKLKKLPFGSDSAKKLRVIVGDQEWWDELQWVDSIGGESSLKSSLDPYFTTSIF